MTEEQKSGEMNEEPKEAELEQDTDSEQEEQSPEQVKDKKIKNLVALSILLTGLLVGSLLVDVMQLVRGGGFSQRILNKSDVFRFADKTWVAYADPVVKVQIITDDTCKECAPDEALVGLRRVLPTILTEKVDIKSDAGKELAQKVGVKAIPAFVFSKEVEETEIFTQAQQIFDKKEDMYVLRAADLGLPVGKYIEGPKFEEGDIAVGPAEAKVRVVEFSDFQCPYCKKMHEEVIAKMLKDYEGKIQFVFKQLPLTSIHPNAQSAALAAACAADQGKFVPYSDKLFAAQEEWGKLKDAGAVFKGYARTVGLNSADFNKCYDEKKHAEQISRNTAEAQELGVTGTPSLFVGDQFQSGLQTYEDLKKVLDEQLAK
ncbi:MAG TPA: thioredoxin domain-containing protein [Candidatus Moranbacteria bacterium]|nr:thioredoxin domain-containing protein [Candidatus Moranbacteria bacterium]